jgi:hypothetical protein
MDWVPMLIGSRFVNAWAHHGWFPLMVLWQSMPVADISDVRILMLSVMGMESDYFNGFLPPSVHHLKKSQLYVC